MAFRRLIIELDEPLCKCKRPPWQKGQKSTIAWYMKANKTDPEKVDFVVWCTICKSRLEIPDDQVSGRVSVCRDLPNKDELTRKDVMPKIDVDDTLTM